MKVRKAPRLILWLLNVFCSGLEGQSIIGDLLEQFHQGRGRLWFWIQGIGILSFRLRRRTLRRSPFPRHQLVSRQALALSMLAISVVLVVWIGSIAIGSSGAFWQLILLGGLVGCAIKALNLLDGTDAFESGQLSAPPRVRIDSSVIPIRGGAGAAALIAILLAGVLTALPELRLPAAGSAILGPIFAIAIRLWRRSHPRPLQGLNIVQR
jgi:hypothetical protein